MQGDPASGIAEQEAERQPTAIGRRHGGTSKEIRDAAAQQPRMSSAEWGMLLTLSVLWGGSFFFTGVALAALPPLTLVALRAALATLILNLVLPFSGYSLRRYGGVWAALVGMCLLNNVVPFCLIVWGQTHIASVLAAILNATTPLFTVVVAHLVTADERMHAPGAVRAEGAQTCGGSRHAQLCA